MKIHKLQKLSLTEQVVETIYEKIANTELLPGDSLPSEMELSEMFGVARPTIREAMNRLMGLGLIERTGNAMMIPRSANLAAKARFTPLILEQWDMFEFYEARMLIEMDLVLLAIKKATPADIQELRRINELLISKDKLEIDGYYNLDMLFHSYIAKISNNAVMQEISSMINQMFGRYKLQVEMLDDIKNATYQNHEELIDAIEEKNDSKAKDVLNRMFSGSEQAMYKVLTSRNIEID